MKLRNTPARRLLGPFMLGLALTGSALTGTGSAAGFAPIVGSALPDAWARPGGRVTLNVPEVVGTKVSVGGLETALNGTAVTLSIPPGTAPGRLQVRFVRSGTDLTLTTRTLEILAPDDAPTDRRLQLLLDPHLNAAQVRTLLLRLLPGIGTVNSLERLPAAQGNGSPCGSTLVDVQLKAGESLEDALNGLLQGGSDVWYPDPISTWRAPALGQAEGQAGSRTPAVVQTSFHYAPAPVSPGAALGLPGSAAHDGAGVTVAVLDTGFSAALDPGHELTDPQGVRLSRVRAPINALVPYDSGNPVPSLAGADDFWEGHGTQVAILAAGTRSGVAPGAQILPIKVCEPGLNGRASCTTKDVLRGLCIALNTVPANRLVLNLSLGGAAPTGAIHAVLNWATRQGAIVVAAGGNGHVEVGSDPEEYPAAFARSHAPGQVALTLLAVASAVPGNVGLRSAGTAPAWQLSNFSTRGSYLNFSAPGERLDLGHALLYSGTSFAAPLASGAAALARQANPGASAAAIQAYMLAPSRAGTLPTTTGQPLPLLKLNGY
ncbi:S8 family serine peptidase [Deinococcus sp. KNUC1210]|uniref:S8 family serine peptidase n=1 Tax=Deinococcus sp. KNUC1210 TaxID=2917691 RepID=UPI001EF10A81|nr:S8 family serine peptidase [Deinococcus sp. KNUC1210]ULH15077.1 S8 family serine peptidase [Deinococcus sp. KNUC1210]